MNLKNTLSYAVCVLMSIALAYYINGAGGVMLCVCLVSALVISLVNFFAVRNKIRFDMKFDNVNLRKGDVFGVTLIVSKDTILPTPYVEIKLKGSEKLTPLKAEIFKTALFSKNEKVEIKAEYKAEYSGKSTVEIDYVRLTDYLGIVSRIIYSKAYGEKAELRVLPDIPDHITSSELLKSSTEATAFSDNDEDTGETARFGSGTPGYEHRAYVPGDPVRKINWKLSSKRDVYLLRLDEKLAVTSQILVLDIMGAEPTKKQFRINDNLIEGSLAVLSSMLMQELECDCWFYANNGWQMIEVNDEKSLQEFQMALANFDETKPHLTRLPMGLEKEKGSLSVIVFTNNLNERLCNEANSPLLQTFFVTHHSAVKAPAENVWCIDDTFDLKRV